MHILIIPSEEYVPNHAPMAGIFQHDQAKILQQKGHQIGVLSFTFKYSFSSLLNALLGKNNKHTKKLGIVALLTTIIKKTFAPFQSAFSYEIKDRIDVIRCDGFWGTKKSNLPLSKYEMWMKYGDCALSTYIEKYGKPDLIHAHNMIYAGLTFTAIGKKNNIPVVITEHSSQYIMGEVNNELKLKLSNTFNASKKIYAVSLELIKQLEQQFSLPINKIKCLPNVLDDFIECKPLSIGKNQRQKVRFLNIANLITLKGQVITQLDDCDVFVLPSHYETFGVVLIEALSRGVPVISTYCGGPECIVDESNGVLVQPKDVDELAQAMLKMYHEYSNYNKEQLRESVINLYGKEAFYKRVIEIYKSV